MARTKINFQQSAILAGIVTASVWLISYLFGLLNIGKVTPLFASVPAVSAITGTVGEKMLGFISGVLPLQQFLTMGILMTYLGALAVVIIGTWAIGSFNLPVFKGFFGVNGNIGRLASVILYGAIPLYVLLVGLVAPSIMTFVGVGIHTILVAITSVWIAKVVKVNI